MDIKTMKLPKNSEEVIQALSTEDEVIYFERVKTLAILGIFYELHELSKIIGRISNKLALGGHL
jgi:acetyl-CoA carboxylase carboxyltransferase component